MSEQDTREQSTPPDARADAAPESTVATEADVVGLTRERDELRDKHLRALADLQNYRRRAEISIQQARETQLADIARALVNVMDHFDLALEVSPSQATVESVLKGLNIVHDELLSMLARFGVERFNAKPGDPFDPNRHEAMMRQKVDGIESGHVASQLQPGYTIGERTLRPAKVSVAE